jgi:hypothetical protein
MRADSCNADGSCGTGNAACGGVNMPCCRGMGGGQGAKGVCSAPGTTCAMPTGTGEARCQACGGIGQPCCDDVYCKAGTCRREDGSHMVCR